MVKKDKANIPVLCFILTFISLSSLAARSQESTGLRSKNGQASEAKPNVAEPAATYKPVPAKPDVSTRRDLVVLDAQVLHQKNGRVPVFSRARICSYRGRREKQVIHFSQDLFPFRFCS